MHIFLSVWGSKSLIEAIAYNYVDPRVLKIDDFKKAFDRIIPQPIVAKNYFIGTACSVAPLVGNFLLLDDHFLTSKPQPIFNIPNGYDDGLYVKERAAESFVMDILPNLDNENYADFVIDLKISVSSYLVDEIVEHFKRVLNCISDEHCFAWHILSNVNSTFYRQVLTVNRPEKMTIPQGHEIKVLHSDNVIFSFSEMMALGEVNNVGVPLKQIAESQNRHALDTLIRRIYWPADVTPTLFRDTVADFFNQLYPFEYEICYEDEPTYGFVCDDNE